MILNVFIGIAYFSLLIVTLTYSLTFINEEYSHVKLKRDIWHSNAHVHFKFKSNVDDGTILTATNQNYDELKLHLDNLKFKLNLEGVDYDIKGLSDVKFNKHSWIDIEIKQIGKTVYVIVDGSSGILKLSRRKDWLVQNWSDITLGADWNTTLPLWKSFIGCIEFPQTYGKNGSTDYIQRSRFVLEDCVDACSFMSCKNGGRCINNYKDIICDCRSTGYEGTLCEEKCVAINFDGLSYLDFIGPIEMENEDKTEHSLRFKTGVSSGILFSTQHSNETLLVEIFQGEMIMTMSYYSAMVRILLGRDLNDDKWHHLLLIRFADQIKIFVDDESSSINALNKYEGSHKEINLSIGGSKSTEPLSLSFSRRNFQGCLQSVYLNKLNILNNVNRSTITTECNGVT